LNKYLLKINGNNFGWAFTIEGKKEDLIEWRDDGLIVEELINTIPDWYVDAGLPIDRYCLAQSLLPNIPDEQIARVAQAMYLWEMKSRITG